MDPLADKFPSVSAYIGMGDNPINATDKDGDWAWVINGNDPDENFRNSHVAKYNKIGQKANSGVIANSDYRDVKAKGYTGSFFNNIAINKLRESAPKIAEHIEKNSIKVFVTEMGKGRGGEHNPNLEHSIALNIDNIPIDMESSFIHEIVHDMEGNETAAYGVQILLNYSSESHVKSLIKESNEMFNGMIKEHPDLYEDYLDKSYEERDDIMNKTIERMKQAGAEYVK